MPRPRLLTDEQESAALAVYRDAGGAPGTVARLARQHNLSWPGMKAILKRAHDREAEASVPRETLNGTEPQP